jgi:putative MFS transporter
MVAAGLFFAVTETFLPLVAAGAVFNLVSAVYSAAMAVYAAELFPTQRRASATATAWGLGRAVSALVPITLLPLLTTYGTLAMFTVVSGALVASVVLIVTAGPPGLTRKSVA